MDFNGLRNRGGSQNHDSVETKASVSEQRDYEVEYDNKRLSKYFNALGINQSMMTDFEYVGNKRVFSVPSGTDVRTITEQHGGKILDSDTEGKTRVAFDVYWDPMRNFEKINHPIIFAFLFAFVASFLWLLYAFTTRENFFGALFSSYNSIM